VGELIELELIELKSFPGGERFARSSPAAKATDDGTKLSDEGD
jgi:hypothetical protein